MANDSQELARLQAKLTARDVELTAMCVTASWSTKPSVSMTLDHPTLRSELDALYPAGRCCKDLLRDFVETV